MQLAVRSFAHFGLRLDPTGISVECIRWQQRDGSPGAASVHVQGDDATCLLDVPTHKTGASFTKPVDPLVGDFIARWEARRRPIANSGCRSGNRPGPARRCLRDRK